MWHQTIIIGNVGKNPETRETQNGNVVCNFSVAVTEKWQQNGERKEKTTWYRISCWGKLAETCQQYVHKGMKVAVKGTVEARGYTNNAGEVAASLELTAREVIFLGSKEDGNTTDNDNDLSSNRDDIPF